MNTSKNLSITEKIHAGPKFLRIFFFLSGIIATIAYRIIFLLDPFWVRISWYIGTVGFIVYFWHRANIETKRANLVKDHKLVSAVNNSNIPENEKIAVSYLVETSLTSKARFNSAFIVVVSALALVASILMDLSIIKF
jgi:hypothetical protein